MRSVAIQVAQRQQAPGGLRLQHHGVATTPVDQTGQQAAIAAERRILSILLQQTDPAGAAAAPADTAAADCAAAAEQQRDQSGRDQASSWQCRVSRQSSKREALSRGRVPLPPERE